MMDDKADKRWVMEVVYNSMIYHVSASLTNIFHHNHMPAAFV